MKIHGDPTLSRALVESAMTDKLVTLAPSATIDDVIPVFDRGHIAILLSGEKFKA